MKQLVAWFIMFCTSCSTFAAESKPLADEVNEFLAPFRDTLFEIVFYSIPFTETLKVPLVVILLASTALFFTCYLGFINIRGFKHATDLVRGKFDSPEQQHGEVNHFQALATALSGTVGLGNIAGVAAATALGGPGATFWMILAGIIGMSTKFAECTLGVKYRKEFDDGTISGGPMYYLKKGFAELKLGPLGGILAIIFAVFCIGSSFGAGNMFQANQSYQQFSSAFGLFEGDKAWIFGLLLAAAVALVIIGGIKSIAKVTEKIVPIMALIYLGAGLVVIGVNIEHVGDAFVQIFEGAFKYEGVAGGFVGILIIGFQRAAFSNEAGFGSASIAHSAVRTDEPVSEGMVSLLEPFVDTIIICTVTALVITITGTYANPDLQGIGITSAAFATVIHWFPKVLSVSAVLFAFSTMIAWSYYGLKAWTFLFGEQPISQLIFKMTFCAAAILGSIANLGVVLDISDALFFGMGFINLIGILVLAPVVKRELNDYWKRLKAGEISKA